MSDEEYNDMLEEDDDADEEIDLDAEAAVCLFCDAVMHGCAAVWQHCSQTHDISLPNLISQAHLDCFSYIKLINYIRTKVLSVL